jgi:hypothetical protein
MKILYIFSVLALLGTASTASAASCSEPYRRCKQICASGTKGPCAAGLCEGFKASCMQTGVWNSPNYRAEGLTKR